MNHDALFVATVDDLASRVVAPRSEYDGLLSSALLRKLLLDTPTLVDLVNRSRRVRVEYVVNCPTSGLEATGRGTPGRLCGRGRSRSGDSPRCLNSRDGQSGSATQSDGRRLPWARNHGQVLTPLCRPHSWWRAFRSAENRRGECAAQALAEQMRVGGYPAGGRTLSALGRVVIHALKPLQERVALDLHASGSTGTAGHRERRTGD